MKIPVLDSWGGKSAAPRPGGVRGAGRRHAGPAAEFALPDSARSAHDFARAHRHSRMVGWLKLGLPAVAALAVVVIIAVFAVSSVRLPSVDLGQTKIEDGKLVMDNPQLSGFDSSQRQYRLSASKAIQDAERPTRISLEKIEAQLPFGDSKFAVIKAGNGVYDAEGKTLQLGGSVAVDTQDGMSIRLEDADIDIATGALKTARPVVVDTGRAVVSSEALVVEDKVKRIVFQDRVRMTIRPGGAAEQAGPARAGADSTATVPATGVATNEDKVVDQ